MKRITSIFLAVILVGVYFSPAGGFSFTSTPSFKPAEGSDRILVIISDLHMGVGKSPDGAWYPTEDFRWPRALSLFLEEISRQGNDRVDLLIAGDFLDMWQPPANVPCQGASADLGCTISEMKTIASLIVQAHPGEFERLRAFAQRGDNRLHFIPGNHDAALLIADVWEPLGQALAAGGGRVNFLPKGTWVSTDGKIVIEHGHQIGNDANRYDTWPDIVRQQDGQEYIIRPWGERFVQKIFNEQEANYPIIDNFAPESAGVVWYRMQERGLTGSISDLARFVAFNLFQTSLLQKDQILGGDSSPQAKPEWNIAKARKLGHRLFLASLPQDDPSRAQLLEDTEQAKEFKQQLDLLALDAKKLPDTDIKMLCDLAALQGNRLCAAPELGAVKEKLLVPKERVFATHLDQKRKEYPRLRYFIYGHTHCFEKAWPPYGKVQILNSGAFQCLMSKEEFLNLVKRKQITRAEGLRQIKLEELTPRYTFIRVISENGGLKPEVLQWEMAESEAAGQIVNPGNESCK